MSRAVIAKIHEAFENDKKVVDLDSIGIADA